MTTAGVIFAAHGALLSSVDVMSISWGYDSDHFNSHRKRATQRPERGAPPLQRVGSEEPTVVELLVFLLIREREGGIEFILT